MERYDAAVIGGGPGGYVTAIRLSQLGFKTILIEKGELGGECTNYGCIPSKYLIAQAKKIWNIHGLNSKKIVTADVKVDIAHLVEGTNSVVKRVRQGIAFLLKEYGVSVVKGKADVLEHQTVQVIGEEGKKLIEAEYIVIATGTEPSTLPSIPTDGERIIDYRKALYLNELPNTMLVVGGGPVGLELGTAYAQLGSKVTVVEIMDQLLPGMDAEASRLVKRSLERMGVKVLLKTSVASYSYIDNRVRVELTNGELETYDYVLVAVGKRPTEWVRKLEDVGVRLDHKGFIKTDERMRTSVENIYAVGDVTGPPFLAHKAHRQGIVAAEAIKGLDVKFDRAVPLGVFTSPEVASVGVDHSETRARIIRFPYSALGRAIAEEEEGFIKLIVDDPTGRLMGAVVVGPHATEIVSAMTPLIDKQVEVEEVVGSIQIHPTYAEAFGEALHLLLKKGIHYVVK